MQIYVSKDGQVFGPYSEENYQKYLDSSAFSDEHLICVDGTNWVPPFEVFSPQKNKIDKPTAKTKNLGASKKFNLGKKIKYIIYFLLSMVGIAVFIGADYNFIAFILYFFCILIPYLFFVFIRFVIRRAKDYKPRSQVLTDNARAFVESIKQTKRLVSVQTKIILKKGETAYYSEQSKLFETRAVRHYQSGSAGIRVMKGVYVGGSRGKSISNEEWKHIDDGTLIITNKRLVFDGFSQNRNFNLSRILSVSQGLDKIEVSIEGRQKSLVFDCSNSIICSTVIHICAQAENPSDLTDVNLDIQIQEPK